MKYFFASFIFLFAAACACAAGFGGLWETVDDETGKPKSIVSVYEENGALYGKILFTYNGDGAPALVPDGKGGLLCDPAKKASEKLGRDLPYCGLVFLKDLKLSKDGKTYAGGAITDPKKGKTYRAEMRLEGANLIVRGKLGPFGRNQTWRPVNAGDLPKGFKY